jgi:hypothetical protein
MSGEGLPDGWLSDAEADELARLAAGCVVLELGAWKGRSTVVLARTAVLVVSVDRHRPFRGNGEVEDALAEYLANVRPLENVAAVVGEFAVADLFHPDAFGLVFVDGVHDFESVTRDVSRARRFDCPLAVHDWGRFKVRPAVRALGLEPTHVVDSLAVFT